MKVIHTGIQSEPAIGVLRQLEAETQSTEHLGIDWFSVLYVGKDMPGRVTERSSVSSENRLAFRFAYYRWLYKKSREYDVILLRYSVYDPMQLIFVLLCNRKIYTIHHTLEVPELKLGTSKSGTSWLSKLKTLVESLLGPITLSMVSGIIGVLPEIRDYNMQRRLIKRNVPNKVYTNGVTYYETIDFSAGNDRQHHDTSTLAPEFLFVSSAYQPWQGLEELVEAAARYDGKFVYNIVGELTDEQTKLLSKDERFVSHGLQNKDYISKLMARSDVGISNLAAAKKNMNNVPALKVREYLMEGLAVYAGHGDVFPDTFEYYMHGPIDLHRMVDFAMKSRKNDRTKISEISRPYIEKELLVKDLYEFLQINQNA